MKKQFLFLIPVILLLVFTACQKEVSNELNRATSSGSLQSDISGECLPKTVQGVYQVGKTLIPDSNYIEVRVNTTSAGNYEISSDVVNGISFKATGNFSSAGINTVRLAGTGTPQNAGNHNFTLSYDSTECTVTISTLGQGGGGQAEFTLAGAPNACTNFVLAGDYVAGVALTNANTVTINIDVLTAGDYNISTTISNGITFSGTGSFANIGQQTVTLTGNGTPAVAGSTNIPVTTGASTCSFTVDVTAVQVFDYFPRTAGSNWSYQFDDVADDSLYIRAKSGTVTLGGNAYTVFEGTVDIASGFDDVGNYRKQGSDYHTYLDIGNYFGFDDPQNIDYIFLKDNVAAGSGWQTSAINGNISGSPISIRISFTIEQKDATIVVGTVSYPNTIVVVEKYEVFDGVSWIDASSVVGYYKTYYARDIGQIKQDYYFEDGNPAPPVFYEQDLRRHQVY